MIVTTRKTAASNMLLIASGWVQVSSRARRLLAIRIAPTIAEARIVLDVLECGVDVAEFLPDALDEGADVGAESDLAFAGREPDTMDNVVELAVADILPCPLHQIFDDAKLGQRQVDLFVLPERAVHVAPEKDLPMADDHGLTQRDTAGRPSIRSLLAIPSLVAVENELNAPGKNLEA